MLQYIFQIYFIFVLFILFQDKVGFAQEDALINEADSPIQKCVTSKCRCDDFVELLGAICNEGSDQINTLWLKESHSNSIKHLPAEFFNEIAIRDLTIDDPSTTIDEYIFARMDILKIFTVRRSSIKIIPYFNFIKDSIQNISIENSGLTRLEGINLQDLPNVIYLSFSYNSINFIDPDVFKYTENVEYLYLNNNQLTSIPPNLLDPMKNLITFQAHSNNLSHIENLFSNKHPQSLIFKNNSITNVSSVLDHTMNCHPQINEESSLTSGKRRGRDRNYSLKTILSRITTLDLSYNAITESSIPIVGYCKNSSPRHQFIVQINELKLTGNNLKKLGFLLRFTEISTLQVAQNQIQHLTAMDFTLSNNISTLELQNNEIRWIDTNTFNKISSNLHSLDLSSNVITNLNGSVKNLYQLRTLNVESNSIQSFAKDEFEGLNELSDLYLQNNHIRTIQQLQTLRHLKYLNIQHNNIELIRPDHIPKSLKTMYLTGNPIKCNCNFQPVLYHLKTSTIETDATDLCLKFGQRANQHKMSKCPRKCSCKCTTYKGDSFIAVDCSSKNLYEVPRILKTIIIDIKINDRYVRFEDNILGINLENNDLASLERAQFPPNLIQLYVSNNKLRTLPKAIINKQPQLKQVTLSGNPWMCNCQVITSKNWITSKRAIILDISNVCCGKSGNEDSYLNNKVLWNLTYQDLCPPQPISSGIGIQYILIFIGLTIVTIALIAQILYNKYALRYKMYRYVNGKANRRPIPPPNSTVQKWEKRPKA